MAKILEGKIISAKTPKTAIVVIERKLRHPVYKKVIRRHKKYTVDVPVTLSVKEGQVVRIKETRPISKNKRFTVVEVDS